MSKTLHFLIVEMFCFVMLHKIWFFTVILKIWFLENFGQQNFRTNEIKVEYLGSGVSKVIIKTFVFHAQSGFFPIPTNYYCD